MRIYPLCLMLLVAWACSPPPQSSPWQRDPQHLQKLSPTVLQQEGPEIHQYWEFADDTALWMAALPGFAVIQAYQDSLRMAMGTEAFDKGKFIRQAVPQTEPDSSYQGDKGNRDIIADGHVGLIRPMHALEAHILNYQVSRFPLFSQPTEFHGFIMRHPQGRVRVYFTASNTLWPPKPRPVIPAIIADTAQGWYLYQHLHNHYEEPEDGYFGIMAPSMPDVQYFRALVSRFALQEALVTNGFQTTVIPAEDLPLLHGDGE